MASRVIGLSGYAQSGKDTTAQILIEDFGFTRVAFADALRDALYALNPLVEVPISNDEPPETWRLATVIDVAGWDSAKVGVPEIRALLQRLGTEVGRDILGENIWVDIAMRKAHEISGPVVVTDMRFPNEYIAVSGQWRGEVWRVSRPGFEPVNTHRSERALDGFDFDKYIENEGSIDDLRNDIQLAMEA